MSFSKYSKHSKLFSFMAKLALMLLAFWFVSRGIDMDELKDMLRSQNNFVFMEAGFFLLLQMLLGAVRWHFIIVALTGAGAHIISRLSALKTYYISVFFNCCLPGTVGGDVVRVFLVKSEHTPLPLAISSVVIDRMLALLALGVMGGITMPIFAGYLGFSSWLLLPLFLLLVASGFWVLLNLERIVSKISFLKSQHWLTHLLQNIRLIIVSPKPAFCSLFYAVMAHITYCLAAYVLADSLGSPISLLDALTLVPWVLLIAIIPISIGGWGLREAAMVYMLGLIGVPQVVALALSVQLGLLSIVISIPAGLLWLTNRKKSYRATIENPFQHN
jgi:uncharacterized protein (TIRG00374 family)